MFRCYIFLYVIFLSFSSKAQHAGRLKELATEMEEYAKKGIYNHAVLKEYIDLLDTEEKKQKSLELQLQFYTDYYQVFREEQEIEMINGLFSIVQEHESLVNGLYNFCNKYIQIEEQDIEQFKKLNDFFITLTANAQKNNLHYLQFMFGKCRIMLGYVPIQNKNIDLEGLFEAQIALLPFLEKDKCKLTVDVHREYSFFLYGIKSDVVKAVDQLNHVFQCAEEETPDLRNFLELQAVGLLIEKGDKEKALEMAEHLVRQDTLLKGMQKVMLNNRLARIYLERGAFNKAEQVLKSNKAIIEQRNSEAINFEFTLFEALQMKYHAAIKDTIFWPENYDEQFRAYGHAQNQYLESLIDLASIQGKDHVIEEVEAFLVYRNTLGGNWNQLPRTNLPYRALGSYYAKKNDFARSIQYFNKAIQRLSTASSSEFSIDAIYEQQHALNIFKGRLKAELAYIKVAPNAIRLEDIYKTANLAVVVLDRLRQELTTNGAKQLLLNEALWVYEQAIGLSYQLYQKYNDVNYLEEAFYFAEKNKAVLLLDALQKNNARQSLGIDKELLDKEESLLSAIRYYRAEKNRAQIKGDSMRLASILPELLKKRRALTQLKLTLEKHYPAYYQLKYQQEPIRVNDLQELLLANQQEILEFVLGQEQSFIFHISARSLQVYQVTDAAHLNHLLEQFYSQITDLESVKQNPKLNCERYIITAKQLYQQLILPVYPHQLPDELLIIPDGFLHYIPFGALPQPNQQAQNTSFSKLAFLINSTGFSYSYSATLWAENYRRKLKKTTSGILAMAPIYRFSPRDDLEQLEEWEKKQVLLSQLYGAEREVDYLSNQFEGRFLKGDQANKSAFMQDAENYGLIHLAMHGLVDERNPGYSALFFAKTAADAKEDILFAYEIPKLKLNAEMVVLSACETGFGKYQRGEGVMSLGRSFMYAGCPSVVLTLWEVNDQVSLKLIKAFYEGLGKGERKPEALRRAKQVYLDKASGITSHPYFWSAFVVHGNPDPIVSLRKKRPKYQYWYLLGFALLGLGVAYYFYGSSKRRSAA